jgi:DNA-binding MarR family transcriptional regulator
MNTDALTRIGYTTGEARIIALLADDGAMLPTEISAALKMSQPYVSYSLQTLKVRGIVISVKCDIDGAGRKPHRHMLTASAPDIIRRDLDRHASERMRIITDVDLIVDNLRRAVI